MYKRAAMEVSGAGTANGTSAAATTMKRRRSSAAPLDSLQTLFAQPPKRRSTGRRRSRSGTPRRPPYVPAVAVSPDEESLDSADARPPIALAYDRVTEDDDYAVRSPPRVYDENDDVTEARLAYGPLRRLKLLARAAYGAETNPTAATDDSVPEASVPNDDAAADDATADDAAAADAFLDDAAAADDDASAASSERHTEWVWRSGLDVSELVDDWGWEDAQHALAERKRKLLEELIGEQN